MVPSASPEPAMQLQPSVCTTDEPLNIEIHRTGGSVSTNELFQEEANLCITDNQIQIFNPHVESTSELKFQKSVAAENDEPMVPTIVGTSSPELVIPGQDDVEERFKIFSSLVVGANTNIENSSSHMLTDEKTITNGGEILG